MDKDKNLIEATYVNWKLLYNKNPTIYKTHEEINMGRKRLRKE